MLNITISEQDIIDINSGISLFHKDIHTINDTFGLNSICQAEMMVKYEKVKQMISKKAKGTRKAVLEFAALPSSVFRPTAMPAGNNMDNTIHIDACTYYAYLSEAYYKISLLMDFAKYQLPDASMNNIDDTLDYIENRIVDIMNRKPRMRKDLPNAILNVIEKFRINSKLCIASTITYVPNTPYTNIMDAFRYELLFAGALYYMSWMKSGDIFVRTSGEGSFLASIPEMTAICEQIFNRHKQAVIETIADAC